MATIENYRRMAIRGALILGLATTGLLTGCTMRSSSSGSAERASVGTSGSLGQNPPGVVNYIWEEPMVNVVEVPPGLDPEGVYYRPSHQEVVEVRQGRWKYYKDQRD